MIRTLDLSEPKTKKPVWNTYVFWNKNPKESTLVEVLAESGTNDFDIVEKIKSNAPWHFGGWTSVRPGRAKEPVCVHVIGHDQEAEKHLASLEITGYLKYAKFDKAQLFVVLVGCCGPEDTMEAVLARKPIIPVICKPGEYETSPFRNIQGLPRSGKPVNSYGDKDTIWLEITKEIKKKLEEM